MTEFDTARKYAMNLPTPTEILEGHVKTCNTTEISAKYSLTIRLCQALRTANQKIGQSDPAKFHKMADYFFTFLMDNFPPDMCVMGARAALFQYGLKMDPKRLRSFDKFHGIYGDAVAAAIGATIDD